MGKCIKTSIFHLVQMLLESWKYWFTLVGQYSRCNNGRGVPWHYWCSVWFVWFTRGVQVEPDEPQGEWVSDSRWGTPNNGGHNWEVGDREDWLGVSSIVAWRMLWCKVWKIWSQYSVKTLFYNGSIVLYLWYSNNAI